jgi:hypothetical protein
MGAGVYHSSQQDVSEPVNSEAVEIIISEIELESAFEVFNSLFKLWSFEDCDGCCCMFEILFCCHSPVSLKKVLNVLSRRHLIRQKIRMALFNTGGRKKYAKKRLICGEKNFVISSTVL